MIRKRILKIVFAILLLWIAIFAVDLFAVASFDHKPIFCIESKDESHYTGLGYSYDAYSHPTGGQFEYRLSVFGIEVISTFTN